MAVDRASLLHLAVGVGRRGVTDAARIQKLKVAIAEARAADDAFRKARDRRREKIEALRALSSGSA